MGNMNEQIILPSYVLKYDVTESLLWVKLDALSITNQKMLLSCDSLDIIDVQTGENVSDREYSDDNYIWFDSTEHLNIFAIQMNPFNGAEHFKNFYMPKLLEIVDGLSNDTLTFKKVEP